MSNEPITNEAPKPGTKPYLEAQLAAANAEIEALKAKAAEAEAKAAETEPNDTEAQETVSAPKRESIYIPRPAHSKDDPNQYVSVNGKPVLLPRGKTSEVPDYIAREIYRSRRAAERYEQTREAELAKAAASEEQMNQKIK